MFDVPIPHGLYLQSTHIILRCLLSHLYLFWIIFSFFFCHVPLSKPESVHPIFPPPGHLCWCWCPCLPGRDTRTLRATATRGPPPPPPPPRPRPHILRRGRASDGEPRAGARVRRLGRGRGGRQRSLTQQEVTAAAAMRRPHEAAGTTPRTTSPHLASPPAQHNKWRQHHAALSLPSLLSVFVSTRDIHLIFG